MTMAVTRDTLCGMLGRSLVRPPSGESPREKAPSNGCEDNARGNPSSQAGKGGSRAGAGAGGRGAAGGGDFSKHGFRLTEDYFPSQHQRLTGGSSSSEEDSLLGGEDCRNRGEGAEAYKPGDVYSMVPASTVSMFPEVGAVMVMMRGR